MNKFISKKKLIIRVLLVIEIITMLLIVITVSKKNAYNLAEMKIKKDEGLFAVMIEDENGEYARSDSDIFPTGYNFNSEKSKCQDHNGEIIPDILSFNTSTNKVNVRTTKTVYCYLYFDKKDDLKIAVSTDGRSDKAPTTLNYLKNITCKSATPSWNNKYNRLVFDNIGESERCNLTFTKDTNTKNYLISNITGLKGSTSGTGSIVDEGDAGIRYEGQNPNNYIWFNNEMWRIIGVIPTKNASGTTENLVKIIRKQSLGGYAYDAKASGTTGAWGSNTLYTLLNSYYWGKNDGTNTEYCYGYQNTAKSKCDYQIKGIESTDYYGSMVREVYWNTGKSNEGVTASAAYTNEKATQTVKGHVGLMNTSDYGYATSENHTTRLSGYNSATFTLGNWLYSNTYEWTLTQDSLYTNYPLYVNYNGSVYNDGISSARGGYGARPVLYLDTKVYIVSGDGTETNPYIVAKES